MKTLPKTIIVLGLISFFNDLASEMIYPLLPLFLTTVLGAGALSLGVVEGAAESVSALMKLASGILSDRVERKKPFVVLGYGFSGLVRPLVGFAGTWGAVAAIRVADRLGKGVRTSPRDALIASAAGREQRGRAYGFHRAMDHGGAVAGPLVAAALLSWGGFSLSEVFFFALIPALVVLGLAIRGIREPEPEKAPGAVRSAPKGSFKDLAGISGFFWPLFFSLPWEIPRTLFFFCAFPRPEFRRPGSPFSGPPTMW